MHYAIKLIHDLNPALITYGRENNLSRETESFIFFVGKMSLAMPLIDTDPYIIPHLIVNESQYPFKEPLHHFVSHIS